MLSGGAVRNFHVLWNLCPPRDDFDLELKKSSDIIHGKYLRKMVAKAAGVRRADIRLTQLRAWRLADSAALINIPDHTPNKDRPKEIFHFVDEKGNIVRDEFVDREQWVEIFNDTPVRLAPQPWFTQVMVVSTDARQILELILVQLSSS